jgi:hypothetical protein
MYKTNLFFGTLPSNPWAMLITQLHLEAPYKYKTIEIPTHFKHQIIPNSYRIGIGHAWYCWKACERCNLPMEVEF